MRRACSVLLVLLLAPAVAAQWTPVVTGVGRRPLPGDEPPPHALGWLEASLGMHDSPELDGGRTELEFGDVNHDGHVDVVMVGDHGSPFINTQQHGVTVWFGDGLGHWSLGQSGDFGYGGVALGDVNDDGLTDVAYGVHHDDSGVDLGDQLIEVALGDGSGLAWLPWDDGLATDGETWGMFGTDLGDVNGDGLLDVASNSFGCCNGVRVYLNHGDGSWSPSFSAGAGGSNSNMDLTFADVDADGHLDVVAASSAGMVWRGDGAGGFVAAEGNLPVTTPAGISAGDVDGDGADEVAFILSGAPQVWSWGAGDQWTSRSAGLPAGGPWQATQLADLDSDGDVDLLAFGQGQLTAWRRGAGGAWEQAASLVTPGGGDRDAEALRSGADADHNGYPDVVLVQDAVGGFITGGNEARFFREHTLPTTLWAHVQAPGAGRVWRQGQARTIGWTCAVPWGSAPGTVTLELSQSGPAGPWTTLAGGLLDDGRHQLVVPAGFSGDACRVRVRVDAPSGSTTAVGPAFTILP